MRQLFLGRGADDEVHKGMTGNTLVISQPSPSYDQVMPNFASLNDGLVVLFCKSVDDVSKAQMLFVNREQYRIMVRHRQKVCPSFAQVSVDEIAINQLPDDAVPEVLMQSAQAMPEAARIHTTMQGPANRFAMTHRQEDGNDEKEKTDSDADADASEESGDDAHHAAQPNGVDPHHAAFHNSLPPETLNENETIIGISEESCPKPLKLFEAWTASMQKLDAEAAKFAQAEMKQRRGGQHSAATAMQQTACTEMVRTSVAVDMIDVARHLSRTSKHRAELQSLVTAQSENEEKTPWEALAVPTGKPLSIFDPPALPAAFTEFLFGDCVPFLKRQTPVTAQQIFRCPAKSRGAAIQFGRRCGRVSSQRSISLGHS